MSRVQRFSRLISNQVIILILLQIAGILLAIFNVLPREIILCIDGILLFFFIFGRFYDTIILFIASIPLFAALPIFESGGSTSFWRIAVIVLLFRTFAYLGFSKIWEEIKDFCDVRKNWKEFRLYYLTILFFIWTVISLIGALSITAGLKKSAFLINIIFLFYIIKKSGILEIYEERIRIIRASVFSAGFVLLAGIIQVASIMFAHLYDFWQFWAKKVVPIFYGDNLANVLSSVNTWFSYYPDKPPTLRMFSVFPDSHSFALFLMFGMIFTFFYIISSEKLFKNKYAILFLSLSLLGVIFSGSRGIWVSLIGIFVFIILYFLIKKEYKDNMVFKTLIMAILIFAILFPISSFIFSFSKDAIHDADTELTLKRLKSITDFDELSNKNRLGIWAQSVKSIIKKPILGVGYGNYPVVLEEDLSLAKYGSSAHNLYLDVASETGIIGLILLIWIFWEIFIKAFKLNSNFSKAFLVCFLWILCYNMFDVVLLNDKVLLFFMVPLAILYSFKNQPIIN